MKASPSAAPGPHTRASAQPGSGYQTRTNHILREKMMKKWAS